MGGRFETLTLKDVGFFEDVPENEDTFYGNALVKAKTISDKFGLPALADDSGLCVESLNGEPGVQSAYYSLGGKSVEWQQNSKCSDIDNNALLLKNLGKAKNREAYFVSCVVIHFPNGKIAKGEGKVYGEILTEPRGENGFGYDPLFLYPPLNKTLAELTAEEKNEISHRKNALTNLLKQI